MGPVARLVTPRSVGLSGKAIALLLWPRSARRIACAHNLLVLTRPLVEGCYRPWETRSKGATLAQVRRALPSLLHQLGTPARPPQLRGKAPGRAKGFHPKPRTRHPAIRKTSKKQKKSKKI